MVECIEDLDAVHIRDRKLLVSVSAKILSLFYILVVDHFPAKILVKTYQQIGSNVHRRKTNQY
jgi:hypothetical protein